ncbi:hypothetical protein ACFQ0M_49315 [Kitasatospora aburaviensis]
MKTTAGTFVFTDGLPTPETAAAVYGRLDRLHAVEAYRAACPRSRSGRCAGRCSPPGSPTATCWSSRS